MYISFLFVFCFANFTKFTALAMHLLMLNLNLDVHEIGLTPNAWTNKL